MRVLIMLILCIYTGYLSIAYAESTSSVQSMEKWMFSAGAVTSSTINSSKWSPLDKFSDHQTELQAANQIITYKTTLPTTNCKSCAIYIANRGYEIEIDGKLVATAGGGIKPVHFPMGKSQNLVHLDANEDGKTILIRMNNSVRKNVLELPIQYGQSENIIKNHMVEDAFTIRMAEFVIMVSIISLIMYFSMNRNYTYLTFAIAALNIGIFMFVRTPTSTLIWFESSPLSDILEYFGIYFLPITCWNYVRSIVSAPNWLHRLNLWIPSLFIVWILINWTLEGVPPFDFVMTGELILLFSFLCIISLLLFHGLKGDQNARLIGLLLGISGFLAIIETMTYVIGLPRINLTAFSSAFFIASQLCIFLNRVQRLNKHLNEQKIHLQNLNERLTNLNQLKDEFIANTSHELRTPLHGMIGLADAMLDGGSGTLTPAAKKNLEMIIASGRRLTNLVNDLLDFAKIRSNGLQLVIQPLHIFELIDSVVTMAKPTLGNKPVVLSNRIQMNTPLILADENRMQQMLHNLVGNAIKFTTSGRIEIAATWNEENVAITVLDTGIGIPAHKINQIFESFEQADGAIAREYGGTGLGLAITKQLALLQKGTIDVKSSVGDGSVFTLILPRATDTRINPTTSTEGTDNITSTGSSALSDFELLQLQRFNTSTVVHQEIIRNIVEETDDSISLQETKAVIWCVDDEPVNLQVLKNHLLMEGYDAHLFNDAIELLNAMETTERFPDLMIVDVMMPYMSGFELTRKLREQHHASELPIIILTAKSQSEDIIEGFTAGANDYIIKPFVKSELLARMELHLQLSKRHANLENQVKTNETAVKQMIASVAQAVLMFDSTLVISGEYTPICKSIIGKDPNGYPIQHILAANDEKMQKWFVSMFQDLFAATSIPNIETYFSLIPDQLEINEKLIGVKMQPVRNPNGKLMWIMVVLSDLSDQMLLDQHLAEEEKLLRMVVRIVSNAKAYETLVQNYRTFIDETLPKLAEETFDDQPSEHYLLTQISDFRVGFEKLNSFMLAPYLAHVYPLLKKLHGEESSEWIERIQSLSWISPLELEQERMRSVLPEQPLTIQNDVVYSERDSLFELKQHIMDTLPLQDTKELISEIEQLYYFPYRSLFISLIERFPNATMQGGEWTLDLDPWESWASMICDSILEESSTLDRSLLTLGITILRESQLMDIIFLLDGFTITDANLEQIQLLTLRFGGSTLVETNNQEMVLKFTFAMFN